MDFDSKVIAAFLVGIAVYHFFLFPKAFKADWNSKYWTRKDDKGESVRIP